MRPIPIAPPPSRHGRMRYLVLAVAVALAGLAGFVGYVLYPRFHLPAVTGVGLLLLAAGAGVASFFSPCSFPLLLTLLARQVGDGPPGRRLRSALVFASAFSVGAVAFVLALGALIGLGDRGLASGVTFTSPTGIAIRIAVGVVLVLLGLIQAEIIPVSFHVLEGITRPFLRAEAGFRRRHPVAGVTAFGFAYLIIGFGWAGPILAGLAGQALTTGGFWAALTAYAVAAGALVALSFAAALSVAFAHERVTERIGASTPPVKRWGGYILVIVGLWFVALGFFADFFARVFPA